MSLITTTAAIKQFTAVDNNIKLASIQPYLDEAEIIFIRDLITEEFLEEIKTEFKKSEPPEKYVKLFPYVQRPLVNYAFFLASSMYGVSFSDTGIQVNQTTDSAPAPQWKVQKIEESWLNSAYTFADVLLEYLEKKKEDFPTWKNSDKATVYKNLYINTTADFHSIRGIGNSRRTFLALRPFISESEPYISSLIGKPLHDEIKTQIKAGTLSDKNKELLPFIQTVVAHYALIQAIPILSVSVVSDGIFINSYNNGLLKKDAPNEKQMQALMDSLERRLAIAKGMLKGFLDSRAGDFPLYQAHINYTAQRIGISPSRYINKPGSKNFLIG